LARFGPLYLCGARCPNGLRFPQPLETSSKTSVKSLFPQRNAVAGRFRDVLLTGFLAVMVTFGGAAVALAQADAGIDESLVEELRALPPEVQEALPDDVREFLDELELSDWQHSLTLRAVAG